MVIEIIAVIFFLIIEFLILGNDIFIRLFGIRTEGKILEIKEIRGYRYLRIDVLVSFITTEDIEVQEIYSINIAADMVAISTQLYSKINKYVEIGYIENDTKRFTIISPPLGYAESIVPTIFLLVVLFLAIKYL